MIPDPGQPSPGFYVPTRRAQSLRTRADVDAYRKDRILPDDLLPPLFAEKVLPLFRRGDYDVAVLQALKEIEVAVRKAVKTKGAGYADSEIGTTLMRKAFHPDTGPLSDKGKFRPSARPRCTSLFWCYRSRQKSPESSGLCRYGSRSSTPSSFSPVTFSVLSSNERSDAKMSARPLPVR